MCLESNVGATNNGKASAPSPGSPSTIPKIPISLSTEAEGNSSCIIQTMDFNEEQPPASPPPSLPLKKEQVSILRKSKFTTPPELSSPRFRPSTGQKVRGLWSPSVSVGFFREDNDGDDETVQVELDETVDRDGGLCPSPVPPPPLVQHSGGRHSGRLVELAE